MAHVETGIRLTHTAITQIIWAFTRGTSNHQQISHSNQLYYGIENAIGCRKWYVGLFFKLFHISYMLPKLHFLEEKYRKDRGEKSIADTSERLRFELSECRDSLRAVVDSIDPSRRRL